MAEPIRYFFDQHVFGAVVNGLRQHGIDVETAHDAGRCGLPDSDQLAYATAKSRVIVTFDPDFLALHNSGAQHAGIAWCYSTKYSIGELIHLLLLLHGVSDADAMKGRVEFL